MKVLGAVLAGGQSSRFGSDKALAELDGQSLLDRAVATLRGQCAAVVVVGREQAPVPTLSDWPAPGMGPLGGVAAALRFARDNGYDAVLTVSVDSFGLGADLLRRLSPSHGPVHAYIDSQPVIGLWGADGAAAAETILRGPAPHSMRALAMALQARAVRLERPAANINTPADLALLQNTLVPTPGETIHGL